MNKLFFFKISAIIFFVGCNSNIGESSEIDLKFIALDSEVTGVTFNNELKSKNDLNIIEYLYYYNGGGVALGDINNDGLDDIFFSGNEVNDQLYLNQGNMVFKNISKSSGIANQNNWSTGVSMANVNNDGFIDIYV